MTDETRQMFAPAPRVRGRFRNLLHHEPHGFFTALRWMLSRKPVQWPETVSNPSAPKPLARVNDASVRVTLIGHATVLLQVAGLNIITDPMWSERAGPTSWLGVKRSRPPAIALDDLPPIDIVLLSHSHYDHLDRPTLRALHERDAPRIVTGLGVGRIVLSPKVAELDWWQSRSLADGITATYVPAQHFSARSPFDRNKTLWGGFVLETPAGAIYFAGDTGDGPQFAAIRARFGAMRLALLPIGAYLPRWFMGPVHIGPHEAADAHEMLGATLTMPIHFDTFRLADDAYGEALDGFRDIMIARGRGHELHVPPFGEPVVLD
jgi:L-ascorbate metabolism protein UlaG (beta-lactamase superfamily)